MKIITLLSSESQEIVIANGVALSEAVVFKSYSKGIFHMPAAWTAADIGFYVSSEADGTYLPLYDGANPVVITGPAADRSYPLPAGLEPALFFKFWSNTAGVDTNQGAERTIIIELKA